MCIIWPSTSCFNPPRESLRLAYFGSIGLVRASNSVARSKLTRGLRPPFLSPRTDLKPDVSRQGRSCSRQRLKLSNLQWPGKFRETNFQRDFLLCLGHQLVRIYLEKFLFMRTNDRLGHWFTVVTGIMMRPP